MRPSTLRRVSLALAALLLGGVWFLAPSAHPFAVADVAGVAPRARTALEAAVPPSAVRVAASFAGTDPGAREAPRPFEVIFAELVAAHGARTTPRAEFSALYGEITRIPNVGDEYCRVLDGLPPDADDADVRLRFEVARIGLEFACERILKAGFEPWRRAPLVAGLVARLAHSPRHAEVLARVFDGRPGLLDGSHEAALLDLGAAARGELAYLQRPVTRLLIQLWCETLVDGSPEVGGLVMLAAGDGPVAVAARVRLLLDPSQREAALAELGAGAAGATIASVARAVQPWLAPDLAAEVLGRIAALDPRANLRPAFSDLAVRDPGVLVALWREALARDADERVRLEAVQAVANSARVGRLAVAVEAFHADPDPRVRVLSLMAIGATGDPSFEGYFEEALAAPELLDAEVANEFVAALDNYTRRGRPDPTFVAGAAEALLALADVLPGQRRWLLERR